MSNAPKTALLVVNLGTPDAPTADAVRRYLAEFLGDRRVVSLPRWFWKPLLHGIILPRRGPASAHKYQQVWLPEGSPLAVYTRGLTEALQVRLPDWKVVYAMRYGQPALSQAVRELRDGGFDKVVVLPLYPQYSTTTTATVVDMVQAQGGSFPFHIIEDYSAHAGWVAAVAESIRDWRVTHGSGEHLIFSFHGVPQRVADKGDPYPQRCEQSVRLITEALGLSAEQWTLAYQSRFGAGKWLQPAVPDVMQQLAARGVRKVDVVCPGFSVDCLETLEEVAMGYVDDFAKLDGELRYIPCLNASDAHADALAELARAQA